MLKYKPIKINPINSVEIAKLVIATFSKFNHQDNKKAMKDYISFMDPRTNSPEEIAERFKRLDINIGAYFENKLIGIVRGRKDRLINLFVDGSFHNQGIGRRLVELFEKRSFEMGSKMIKLKSSLYANDFYQKLGYKKTTGIRNFHGIKIQPMKKAISKR